MVSNKVLVKADVTQFQSVGSGGGPSARQLFNAVRGRGTTPGSKVNVLGRAAGLAGLAGKGAAAAATALSTADAMQGGNIAAPLGAGYTYQGLDPTGAMTAEQIEGTVPQAPQTPAPTPNNQAPKIGVQAPVMPPAHQQQFTPEGNPIPKPDNTGGGRYDTNVAVSAPTQAAPATTPPADPYQTQLPAATAPAAPAPALGVGDMASAVEAQTNLQPVGVVPGTTPQPAQTVAPQPAQTVAPQPAQTVAPQVARPGQPLTPAQMRMNGITGPPDVNTLSNSTDDRSDQLQSLAPSQPTQPIQPTQPTQPTQSNQPLDPATRAYLESIKQPPADSIMSEEEAYKQAWNKSEFTDMLFDILGPDNLYKMTPNEIGELAAFMYIKTR